MRREKEVAFAAFCVVLESTLVTLEHIDRVVRGLRAPKPPRVKTHADLGREGQLPTLRNRNEAGADSGGGPPPSRRA